jgi:hypothetical protein
MFWRRADNGTRDGASHPRSRLLLALEFATLGAYELFEQAESAAGAGAREELGGSSARNDDEEASCHRGRARRTLRPAPSCHSSDAIESERCSARVMLSERAHGKRQRGGAVETPRQPCVWPGA